MKLLIVILLSAFSLSSFAGAPGHGGYFCASESGRTQLTIIDRFEGGEGVTLFFSIDGYSMIYDKNSLFCTEDECQQITLWYNEDNAIYTVNTAESIDISVEIKSGGKKAVIKKGFVDPRDFSVFNKDIILTCRYVEEQI